MDAPLDAGVEAMREADAPALVVIDGDGRPVGVLGETDALRALLPTATARRTVQVFGVDLLDDLTVDEVAETLERLTDDYAAMRVLEANVSFHRHDETFRGTPLLLARIRLFTDKGRFVAAGDVLERQLFKRKTYGRNKKRWRTERSPRFGGETASDEPPGGPR